MSEPSAAQTAEAARAFRNLFRALVDEGFSEAQALTLVGSSLAGPQPVEVPTCNWWLPFAVGGAPVDACWRRIGSLAEVHFHRKPLNIRPGGVHTVLEFTHR